MVNADMQTAADVQYHQNEIADVIGRELSIVFKVLVITQDISLYWLTVFQSLDLN